MLSSTTPLSVGTPELLAEIARLAGGPTDLASAAQEDQRRRWAEGVRVGAEVYAAALPALRADADAYLDLIVSEYRHRADLGERLELSEYERRFPELATRFRQRLGRTGGDTSPEDPLDSTFHHRPPAHADELTATAASAGRPLDGRVGMPSRYEILREVGRGGMGVVYQARDRKRDRVVALKTFQGAEPTALYRFKSEFHSAAALAHPNLVSLYEMFAEGDAWFFSMEWVEGTDFLGHVRPGINDDEPGRRDLPRLRDAAGQLAGAIQALHSAGVIHRDLKNRNVMVREDGVVKVLDFGLAAGIRPDGFHDSTSGKLLGTIPYMSPEQSAGRPLTRASDWYSFGVMLFEALTGVLPHAGSPTEVLRAKEELDAPSARSLAPETPEDLNRLVAELLSRDPGSRPAGEAVLRRLAVDSSVPSRPPDERERLFGCDRHLEILGRALGVARRGEPSVAYVRGESGVGKSALVRHFLASVGDEPGAVVLTGKCYEQESVPYKALDGVIDSLSRHLGRVPAAECQAALPRDVAALKKVFPVLGRVPAVNAAPARELGEVEPRELRRRGAAALRELLARLGDRGTLILSIDDIQWGDADSGALLQDLLKPPEPPTMLLILSARDTDETALVDCLVGKLRELAAFSELEVLPLGASDAEALAQSALGDADSDDPRVAEITRESAGNPLFIWELAKRVRDSTPGGGVSLEDALWERVLALPGPARRFLEVTAVAGRGMCSTLVARAARLAEDERGVVAELEVAHLLRRVNLGEDTGVAAYHDRVTSAVMCRLGADALRDRHAALADALECEADPDPAELAVHALAAGRSEAAARHFETAADRAASMLAFRHAAGLYARSLELTPADGRGVSALRARRADALANAGLGMDAAEDYLLAAGGADGLEKLELRRRAATQLLCAGRVDAGMGVFRSVLGELNFWMPATPGAALRGLILRRFQLWVRGYGFRPVAEGACDPVDLCRVDICASAFAGLSMIEPVYGAYFQSRGLLLSLGVGEPYRVFRAFTTEATHLACLGPRKREKTERLLGRAEELAARYPHPHAGAILDLARGMCRYLEGDWESAIGLLDTARRELQKDCSGLVWERDAAATFALWARIGTGDIAEIARMLPGLIEDAKARDSTHFLINLNSDITTFVRLAADRPGDAERELTETAGTWPDARFQFPHHNITLSELLIRLYQGRGAEAYERLRGVWDGYKRSCLLEVQHIRADIIQTRARAALAASKSSNRRRYLRLAEADVKKVGRESAPWATAIACFLRALIAAIRGETSHAVTLFRDAIERLDRADMRLFAAASRRRLGELIGGDEGRTLVAESGAWMAGQGIVRPDRMADMLAPGFP